MSSIIMSHEDRTLYDVLDLMPADVTIEKVAHRLALINRFGGSTVYPYSVAQHSVLVSYLCQGVWALEALLHDMAEAYITDLPTPIKDKCPDFRRVELMVEDDLRDLGWRLPVPGTTCADAVKCADRRAFEMEAQQIKQGRGDHYLIREMDWRQARGLFLARYHQLVALDSGPL